ncbi:MAG: hypothetical protein WCF59_14620 [Desulfobaccales bacterium]|jgi:hypothetical protein
MKQARKKGKKLKNHELDLLLPTFHLPGAAGKAVLRLLAAISNFSSNIALRESMIYLVD